MWSCYTAGVEGRVWGRKSKEKKEHSRPENIRQRNPVLSVCQPRGAFIIFALEIQIQGRSGDDGNTSLARRRAVAGE